MEGNQHKIAIIGAGISGLSVANILKDRFAITIFEKENRPGGLIRCDMVKGSLFHTCGGHVFNSKREDVLKWFWSKFDCDKEFTKADRNSCVYMENPIPYPIENHIYYFDAQTQNAFYEDLDEIDKVKGSDAPLSDYDNFGDFLRWRFGKTLYERYFQPYNKKVWRRDLSTVPLSWMEGKLPMPSTQEMRINNAGKVKERNFVHSSFWYEKNNGSQFLADRLADGLDIRYNSSIDSIEYDIDSQKWTILSEEYDIVIFCGNVKDLVKSVKGVDISRFYTPVAELQYHGTTAAFCEIDANEYSWIYLPSEKYQSHRIICTGNFSDNNNDHSIPKGRITATVEFTDYIDKSNILKNLSEMPLNPSYITHKFNEFSYPIQNAHTRELIQDMKCTLSQFNIFFTGRFADWEYYNMDVAIGAAMDLCSRIMKFNYATDLR